MLVNKGKEKNALTLVGLELVTSLELVTPGQEARVLTISHNIIAVWSYRSIYTSTLV